MLQRLDCPVTGAPADVIFSRSYTHPELMTYAQQAGVGSRVADRPFEVRFCPASGLHFQTWVLDDTELANLYSPQSSEASFEGEIRKQELHWFAHLTEEILVMRQLVSEKRPRVLDFGCNWGKWASMALAHGCEVYGVDVNRDAAAFCATRGIRMLTFEELRGLRFDFINADQVMEHLNDPLRVVKGLGASLKPDGFLKLATPANPQLPRQLCAAQACQDDSVLNSRTLDSLAPFQHVNLFDARSLEALGHAAGLETVRLPFWQWLGAGQLWNLPRQFNRNCIVPVKRALGSGTYRWFRKPPA